MRGRRRVSHATASSESHPDTISSRAKRTAALQPPLKKQGTDFIVCPRRSNKMTRLHSSKSWNGKPPTVLLRPPPPRQRRTLANSQSDSPEMASGPNTEPTSEITPVRLAQEVNHRALSHRHLSLSKEHHRPGGQTDEEVTILTLVLSGLDPTQTPSHWVRRNLLNPLDSTSACTATLVMILTFTRNV